MTEPTRARQRAAPAANPAASAHEPRGAAREVREGRRAQRARGARTRRARTRPGRGARPPGCCGTSVPEGARRRLVPAGRIQSAAGTDMASTLLDYVQPVGDSIRSPGMPASTRWPPRRPRRCAPAAASATTGVRPRGAWSATRGDTLRTSVSYVAVYVDPLLRHQRRRATWRARWACCVPITPTSRSSSTPRTAATWPTSTSRSA